MRLMHIVPIAMTMPILATTGCTTTERDTPAMDSTAIYAESMEDIGSLSDVVEIAADADPVEGGYVEDHESWDASAGIADDDATPDGEPAANTATPVSGDDARPADDATVEVVASLTQELTCRGVTVRIPGDWEIPDPEKRSFDMTQELDFENPYLDADTGEFRLYSPDGLTSLVVMLEEFASHDEASRSASKSVDDWAGYMDEGAAGDTVARGEVEATDADGMSADGKYRRMRAIAVGSDVVNVTISVDDGGDMSEARVIMDAITVMPE